MKGDWRGLFKYLLFIKGICVTNVWKDHMHQVSWSTLQWKVVITNYISAKHVTAKWNVMQTSTAWIKFCEKFVKRFSKVILSPISWRKTTFKTPESTYLGIFVLSCMVTFCSFDIPAKIFDERFRNTNYSHPKLWIKVWFSVILENIVFMKAVVVGLFRFLLWWEERWEWAG